VGQDTDELRRDIARTRDELGGTLDAIGDRVSPSRIMERRKNRVRHSVESVRNRVMGSAQYSRHGLAGAAHAVHDSAGSAVDTVRHVPEAARERAEGAPMVAGALAFGVGFLAAAAFPPSRTEREMGPALLEKIEPVRQDLAAAGSTIAADLKEPAQQAASELADRVRLGAEDVVETAKHDGGS
jgi:Protein of unknown function (DUF3618)